MDFEISFVLFIILTIGGSGFLLGMGYWALRSSRRRKCPVCNLDFQGMPNHCPKCSWSVNQTYPDFQLHSASQLLKKAFSEKRINAEDHNRVNAVLFRTCHGIEEPLPQKDSTLVIKNASTKTRVPEKVEQPEIVDAELVDLPDSSIVFLPGEPSNRSKKEILHSLTTPVNKTEVSAPKKSAPTEIQAVSKTEAVPQKPKPLQIIDDTTEAPKELPIESSPPTTTLHQFLAKFLHEKNIRWGELVGGLLVISCSIALVISFWSTISQQPIYKFGVFTTVTASFFLLGLHAHRRWRLPNTSRVVLIIALLLVPLDFLAIASMTEASQVGVMLLLGEFLTIGLFAFLSYLATRILVQEEAIPITISLIGLSAYQLLVRRLVVDAPGSPIVVLLSLGLVALFMICTGGFLIRKFAINYPADENHLAIYRGWIGIGISGFAFLTAAGFLILRILNAGGPFYFVTPAFCFAAIPVMLSGGHGLLIARRDAVKPLYIPSTLILLSSCLIVIGALVTAWNHPIVLVATVFSAVAVLSLCFFTKDIPAAIKEFIGIVMAAILLIPVVLIPACLEGKLAWTESTSWTVALQFANFQAACSMFVYSTVGILGVLSWQHFRGPLFRRAFVGFLGLMGTSLLLVTYFGFGNPQHIVSVAIIFMVGTIGAYLASRSLRQSQLQWLTAVLMLGTVFQLAFFGWFAHWNWELRWVWTCVIGTFVFLASSWSDEWLERFVWQKKEGGSHSDSDQKSLVPFDLSRRPLCIAGLSLSLVTFGLTLICSHFVASSWIDTVPFFLLSIALFGIAIQTGNRLIGIAGSVTAFFGVSAAAFLVQDFLPWGTSTTHWISIENAYTQSIGLALFGIGCFVAYFCIHRLKLGQTIGRLSFSELADDSQFLGRAAVIGCIASGFVLSAYAAVPGVVQELIPLDMVSKDSALEVVSGDTTRLVADPAGFEIDGIAHLPVSRWAMVALLAFMCCGIAIHKRFGFKRMDRALIAAAMYSAVFMGASCFESTVSVASALRWLLAIMFVLGLAEICRSMRFKPSLSLDLKSKKQFETVLNWGIICVIPLIGMAVLVGCFALQSRPLAVIETQILVGLAMLAVVGSAFWVHSSLTTLGKEKNETGRSQLALATAVLLGLPLFAYTIFVVGLGLGDHPITGPSDVSLFATMGRACNFSVPTVLIATGLLGTAIWFRNGAIGIVGALILNLSATTAYLLILGKSGLSRECWIELAQLNCLVASLVGIAWYFLLSRIKDADRKTANQYFEAQVMLATGFASASVAALIVLAILDPTQIAQLSGAARWIGCLALLAVAAICYLTQSQNPSVYRRFHLPLLATFLAVLSVCFLGNFDYMARSPEYLAYLFVFGIAVTGLSQISWNRQSRSNIGFMIHAAIVFLFGIQFFLDMDTQEPATVTIFVCSLLLILEAAVGRNRLALWLGVGAFLISSTIGWLFVLEQTGVPEFLLILSIALSISTVVSVVVVQIWNLKRNRSSDVESPTIHCQLPKACTVAALVLTSVVSIIWLAVTFVFGNVGAPDSTITALSIASLAVSIYSNLWLKKPGWVMFAFFVLGLNVVSLFLQILGVGQVTLTWCLPAALAMFSLGASYCISRRTSIAIELQKFRMLPKQLELSEFSAVPVTFFSFLLVISAVVVSLGFFAQFQSSNSMLRELAAQAILVQAVALAILIERDSKSNEQLAGLFSSIRNISLAIGALGTIAAGWSWLPANEWTTINRLAVIGIATSVLAWVYGTFYFKLTWFSQWQANLKAWSRALIGVSGLVAIGVVAVEAVSFWQGDYSPQWIPAMLILATLLILIVTSFLAAFEKNEGTFQWGHVNREFFVYAAQLFALSIAVHLRLTWPALFSGWFVSVWPLVLAIIAFIMLGVSEWSYRRGLTVIANPFRNSGVLVSFLPIVGYWFVPSMLNYSVTLVMLTIGYSVVAFARRSIVFGGLALVSGNIAFWFLLHEQSIDFMAHPQVWLIPVSLLVLIAAQLNKENISLQQLTATRYAAAMVIYVSSTAEIFIHGVGEAPWLPIVLAALSIVGMGAGIGFQIRAFLWLGMSFLLVALFTVIWYAAVDLQQTWIWYLCGIITGIAIITIFAIFEKRRNDLLKWLGGLKHWEQ